MNPTAHHSIALLIDADNAPSAKIDFIISELASHGVVNIRRACSAVKAAEDDEGWARLGPVGSHISNLGPFDHRTYGFKKLSDLFAAIDLFEVKKEKSANQTVILVRIKKGSGKKVA